MCEVRVRETGGGKAQFRMTHRTTDNPVLPLDESGSTNREIMHLERANLSELPASVT
jgi:hypothetical protein